MSCRHYFKQGDARNSVHKLDSTAPILRYAGPMQSSVNNSHRVRHLDDNRRDLEAIHQRNNVTALLWRANHSTPRGLKEIFSADLFHF